MKSGPAKRDLLREGSKKRSGSFLNDIREELTKVSWPAKDELMTCTKIVISATFIFGMGIYLADLTIKGVLDGISTVTRVLFG